MNTTLLIVALGAAALFFVLQQGAFILVAWWRGLGVTEVAIGFGPKLLKGRIGGTAWSLSALPLGAFCRFASHETLDQPGAGRRCWEDLAHWERFVLHGAGMLAPMLVIVALLGVGEAARAMVTILPGFATNLVPDGGFSAVREVALSAAAWPMLGLFLAKITAMQLIPLLFGMSGYCLCAELLAACGLRRALVPAPVFITCTVIALVLGIVWSVAVIRVVCTGPS